MDIFAEKLHKNYVAIEYIKNNIIINMFIGSNMRKMNKKNQHNNNYIDKKYKLKIFETFSGIGSQHKALTILSKFNDLDFEIVGTSEWDIDAIISYASIHNMDMLKKEPLPSTKDIDKYLSKYDHSFDGNNLAPIEKVLSMKKDKKELYYKAHKVSKNKGSVKQITWKDIGKVDILTYSFPCQDLSTAGSFHGLNKGMSENSNTRSSLIWEIGRILRELKEKNNLPKVLLLENVLNMLSKTHNDEYIKWKKFLYELGYKTKTYRINAIEHGTPQRRIRVFAISYLNINLNMKYDDYEIKDDSIEEEIKCSNSNNLNNFIKDINEVLKTNYDNENLLNEALNSIPNNTPSRLKIKENNPILNDNKNTYCRTITKRQDRNPNAGIIDIKNTVLIKKIDVNKKCLYRFLTPRECFILMGFDDNDFNNILEIQEISKHKLYSQAGNSIVVNVLVSIFENIYEKIKELKWEKIHDK